MQKKTFPLLNR